MSMQELKVFAAEDGTLITNKGVFKHKENWENVIVSDETGEVFYVAAMTTDENGKFSEIWVENV